MPLYPPNRQAIYFLKNVFPRTLLFRGMGTCPNFADSFLSGKVGEKLIHLTGVWKKVGSSFFMVLSY